MNADTQNKSIGRLVAKLLATGVGMFVFAIFVMPPIYDVLCDITGLNGKTGQRYTSVDQIIQRDKEIKVQFIASNNETMPWYFKPAEAQVVVHPGQEMQISYIAKNPTDRHMIGQAIPSVAPFEAADYFHKTECFCFHNQPLAPGEEAELVLRFIVDQDLPEHLKTLTLAYTMFDITDYKEQDAKQESPEVAATAAR